MRNLVIGQEAKVHYGEDGIRTIFIGTHHVVRSPYEIKNGKRIERMAWVIVVIERFYQGGERYIAVCEDRAEYPKFEISLD